MMYVVNTYYTSPLFEGFKLLTQRKYRWLWMAQLDCLITPSYVFQTRSLIYTEIIKETKNVADIGRGK